jgi:sec-independent protein translocase protein TatA
MFELGPEKILVVLVLALVIFGPKQLPEIARNIGKATRTLRGVQDEVRQHVTETLNPIGESIPLVSRPVQSEQGEPPSGEHAGSPESDPASGASFS